MCRIVERWKIGKIRQSTKTWFTVTQQLANIFGETTRNTYSHHKYEPPGMTSAFLDHFEAVRERIQAQPAVGSSDYFNGADLRNLLRIVEDWEDTTDSEICYESTLPSSGSTIEITSSDSSKTTVEVSGCVNPKRSLKHLFRRRLRVLLPLPLSLQNQVSHNCTHNLQTKWLTPQKILLYILRR